MINFYRFLRRVMPYGFWAGLAFVAGIPLALAGTSIIEAVWFGGVTGFPQFAIWIGAVMAFAAFVAPFFRVASEYISEGIGTAGFLVIIGYLMVNFHDGNQPAPEDFGWFIVVSIAAGLLLMLPLLMMEGFNKLTESPAFRSVFGYGSGGSARWAGPYTYHKMPQRGAIFLGSTLIQDTLLKQDVGLPYSDDAHFLTIAQTGAGKSVTALWPSLETYKGPMAVIDPKGEHADHLAGMKGFGNMVVLDPFAKLPQASPAFRHRVGFNPLSEIDINASNARACLTAVSSACVFDEKGDNIHFAESAVTIIEGVIAHVLSRCPVEEHTLAKVVDLFRGYDPEIGVSDPKAFDDVISDMSTNDVAGGIAMDAAGLLLSAADRERGSMLTTCFRSLKWVNDPAMREHLCQSTPQRLKQLVTAQDKASLFIVLPFEYMQKNAQIRWMRLLVNLLNVKLFQHPRDGKERLLFVLDEFFKFGYMPSIEEGIVTARGAGAKYWILLQNIGQLKELYAKNWETFVSSSNVQLFGVSDGETADWAAAAVGGDKDRDTGSYPLMRPDEIRQFLGKDMPKQIVIPVNGAPMRLERLAYKPLKSYRGK